MDIIYLHSTVGRSAKRCNEALCIMMSATNRSMIIDKQPRRNDAYRLNVQLYQIKTTVLDCFGYSKNKFDL